MPRHSRMGLFHSWQAEQLEKGMEPDCKRLAQLSWLEANETIHFSDGRKSPPARPIAKHLGKNSHINDRGF